MRYAIFSDIHGNLPALSAALDDAKAQGADGYLFLGDYYRDFPWANEVAELIRGLSNATVIAGNNEGYLRDMRIQDQGAWAYEQLALAYWNYRALSEENLDYLTSLPDEAVIQDDGGVIHLAHSRKRFFRNPRIELFHSSGFRVAMERSPFGHEAYLSRGREALLSCKEAVAEIRAMPKGVYLFGHNHLQFYMEYEGRLFVNPGGCGTATDFDNRAAYSILSQGPEGWMVAERRVDYDLNAAIAGLRDAAGFPDIWRRVIEGQYSTARDWMSPFLSHVGEVGRKYGDESFPVRNEAWWAAVKTWKGD